MWKTRFAPSIVSLVGDGATMCMDGLHAIDMDARGHSGSFVTQGEGAVTSVSKKLVVVTMSSTETQIAATGEKLPKCTWFRCNHPMEELSSLNEEMQQACPCEIFLRGRQTGQEGSQLAYHLLRR